MINQQIKELGSNTSTEDFIELIDLIKITNQQFNVLLLVELLSERHPIYKNRSSIASSHMRGYLIEAFYSFGMPQKGLPYILEELETSFSPYVIAASAKAIRGIKEPHPGVAAFLNKSIYNIWQADAIVNYSSFLGPYNQEYNTTALKEIFESLKWLKGKAQYVLPDLYHLETQLSEYLSSANNALLTECIETIESATPSLNDCCAIPIEVYNQADTAFSSKSEIELGNIILQDQEENQLRWDDYFKGKYTVLSFFYTKCHNPRKCIQTIYNLVNIQKKIIGNNKYKAIQTAAITYDSLYDTSTILKSYGNNRNYQFDKKNRMFRVISGMESLIESLNIGVNYKGNEVNVHRIEVYIINPEGKIEKSFLRFQAEDKLIMDALNELISDKSLASKKSIKKEKITTVLNRVSTVMLPIFIAFFPKCPMCWMAYLNLIGISSIVSIKHQPWLVYVFIGLAIVNLFNLYRLSKKRNGMLPFYLALFGTVLLGVNYWLDLSVFFLMMGLLLTFISTLLNSLSFKLYHKLFHFINKKWITLKYA